VGRVLRRARARDPDSLDPGVARPAAHLSLAQPAGRPRTAIVGPPAAEPGQDGGSPLARVAPGPSLPSVPDATPQSSRRSDLTSSPACCAREPKWAVTGSNRRPLRVKPEGTVAASCVGPRSSGFRASQAWRLAADCACWLTLC
jgi:hypothetical protein